MLKQIFSLYIESLLLTTALIGGLSGILILARMASRKDKTAKARQAHLFDVLMIDIMTRSTATSLERNLSSTTVFSTIKLSTCP